MPKLIQLMPKYVVTLLVSLGVVTLAMLIVLGHSDSILNSPDLEEIGWGVLFLAPIPAIVLGTVQYLFLKKGKLLLHPAKSMFIFLASLALCFTLGFGLSSFLFFGSGGDGESSGVFFVIGIVFGNEILIASPIRSLISIAIAFLAYRYIIIDRVLVCEWEDASEEPEDDVD